LETVADGQEALDRLDVYSYELVFADPKVPTVDGIELLKRIKAGDARDTEVIMMSSNGSIPVAVQAIKLGALDFVKKPIRAEQLLNLLADTERRRTSSVPAATGDPGLDVDRVIVGQSEAIQRVKRMIRIAARTDANVLIHGETGVGKDLIASVVHRESHRRNAPYVKVGCTLLPPSLIESELFGHEEGSFTGADQPRTGRFELAEGGTIYLDDVDDIPLEQQAKLLRAIEEKVFERVGGTKLIEGNVRIVASTKLNLLDKISEGTFRQDLYYRLDVLRIRVPALRNRREDIPALTEHLMKRITQGTPYRVDAEAVAILNRHSWPGNVRELYHTLERAWLISGGHITADLLEADLHSADNAIDVAMPALDGADGGFKAAMDYAERQLLLSALTASKGNKTAAAASLGMKPSTFRDKLAKHEIK
jgi:DNA-binding NtrC family response regulator